MVGMSETVTEPPRSDPRIPRLIQLVQGVMSEYSNLATRVLPRLNDDERAEALEHVLKVNEDAREAISEICALGAPRDPSGS